MIQEKYQWRFRGIPAIPVWITLFFCLTGLTTILTESILFLFFSFNLSSIWCASLSSSPNISNFGSLGAGDNFIYKKMGI